MDVLTDEDRALIDAALQAGKVRKIPTGQGGDVRKRAGRRKDEHTITRVKLLANSKLNDREIAETIGKTQKAVSNCRYRHGITNGLRSQD